MSYRIKMTALNWLLAILMIIDVFVIVLTLGLIDPAFRVFATETQFVLWIEHRRKP